MTRKNDDAEAGCTCAARERRDFLKQAPALAAMILAAIGAEGPARGGMPVAFGRATGAAGDERTYPVPPADGATIDHDNQVIVARFDNKAYAFLLSCPHQNTALRWLPADHRFQCPRHQSKYKPDGEFIEGRATRNMDRFAIRRTGGTLVVDLARWFQSDRQKAEWEAAFVQV